MTKRSWTYWGAYAAVIPALESGKSSDRSHAVNELVVAARRGSVDNVTFGPSGSDCRYQDHLSRQFHIGVMEAPRVANRIKVVVASTDPNLRKTICLAFVRDRRFEVVAQAEDGDALIACPIEFDAAIVDVSISGLGVLGVMSSLHTLSSRLVMVVVSRTDAIYLRHACLAEGADEYMILPDDLDRLPEGVARLLRRRTVEQI